jgi:tRNA (cmo5U34)-methyltransferase
MSDFDWKPDDYLERVRAAIPSYDELQEQAIAAIPSPPERVLELGMGTGETTRRLIEAYPDSWVIGLDSSPDMVFRAREAYDDVQLARIEDPLPDGPWDLVISVLSLHHLTSEQKKNLFRQVRVQARSFVIGDVVKATPQIAPIDPDYDFLERATDLAEWTGGEITWEQDDLAVVRAVY